jgi:clan AA aspartic protease (TIGR02281 family)
MPASAAVHPSAFERRLSRLLILVLGLAAAGPAPGQTLNRCNLGEQVTDTEGNSGVIVGAQGEVCLLRYGDGQTRGWAAWSLRPAAAALPPPGAAPGTVVLRGNSEPRPLVYHADSRGHFTIDATANDAPIRFLVDTGATLVFLSTEDARAAGIDPDTLHFDQTATTSNGPVRVAPVVLREIRIDDLSVERVPAAVIDGLAQSVLGMSFLARLKSFEISSGALTIDR